MSTIDDVTRRVACYHEAGHAAVAWALGIPAKRVTVPFGEGIGAAVEPDFPMPTRENASKATPDFSHTQRRMANQGLRTRAEIVVVVYLAGSISEAHYSGRTLEDCLRANEQDNYDAYRMLRSWFSSKLDREKAAGDACNRAYGLIDHNRGWQAVTSVADAVYDSSELLFPEVDALCSTAFQRAQPSQEVVRRAWPRSLELIRAGNWPPQ